MTYSILFQFYTKRFARDLVRSLYLGILNRQPEDEGLDAYARNLQAHGSLAGIAEDIALSEESWERQTLEHGNEIVRSAFLGLLGREPEPQALEFYAKQLAENRDIPLLLSQLSSSQEHFEKTLSDHRAEVVRSLFLGLLDREPDPAGLAGYGEILATNRSLAPLLTSIVQSDEFSSRFAKHGKWPHPATSYTRRTIVFIHIQKTAGTSMQNMLNNAFPSDQIYKEHADTLHLHCPGELSRYSVFAGHFNYDSLAYIPRQRLSIFTFVREPKQRLISLYFFWRAHEPAHPSYHSGMELANNLTMEQFFNSGSVTCAPEIWNHMAWAIMGQRQWSEWRTRLSATGDAASIAEILSHSIRPAICRRLREFDFVGILEMFDASAAWLAKFLGVPIAGMRKDHSLEKLMATEPNFKSRMDRQPITSAVEAALDSLIVLDTIVYEEAKKLYAERSAEY